MQFRSKQLFVGRRLKTAVKCWGSRKNRVYKMSCSKQCIDVNTLVLSCWGLKIPIFYPVLQIFKTILHAPLSPCPPLVLLLHRLPVESALIAQTSIFARFHWYVSVLKFGLLKSSELLELCLFIILNCCLLFVVSFRLILHWSPEPSISVLTERNNKATDDFPTKTTWGLCSLSGNSYSYFLQNLAACYSGLLIPTGDSSER